MNAPAISLPQAALTSLGRQFRLIILSNIDRASFAGKLPHVAQSLFHDHVPAPTAGLPIAWISRRGGRARY